MTYDLGSRSPLEGRPHPSTVTKATSYGVEQVDEAGHRLLLISAEVMDAAIAGLLADNPYRPQAVLRKLTLRERISWAIRGQVDAVVGAIHDRLFRAYCDHDGCY